MKLNIGNIELPINAATKTMAILAKRGAGKTYTAAVLAEEYFKAGIPFVVIDPIDVWYGLRVAANGKDKGLPIVVFGARNADIPLNRDMGREIAQAIVKDNVSCVISTYGLPKVAQRHLIAEFAEELLNINNRARHVFIEEAHEFVPQRVQAGMGKCFSAVESLVVMGRNKGLGVTLINQRAATVNKDVLTQLDTLLAFRNVAPQDRKALQEWVEAHGAEGDFEAFMKSLPSLPTGEGWIWSPEFMGVFERIKIRKRETFHPDPEKIGNDFVVPTIEQSDVQEFIARFKTAEKKVAGKKEKTVQAIKENIPVPIVIPFEEQVRGIRNEYESKIIEKDAEIRRLTAIISQVARAVGSDVGPVSAPISSGGIQLWRDKLGDGLAGRAFQFISENSARQFTREQICLAIGVPAKAGHTNNEFGKLMRTGAVVKNGHLYQLNPNL